MGKQVGFAPKHPRTVGRFSPDRVEVHWQWRKHRKTKLLPYSEGSAQADPASLARRGA
jgi:hypothetical protein